ncbi:MAG: DUF2309 domain-containing protein [Pseudoxanthomonas sp.]
MNAQTQSPPRQRQAAPLVEPAARALDVLQAAQRATRWVAPLWPLQNFVAVNPFLGLTDRHFVAASEQMSLAAGARMTMPRSFYASAITAGRIRSADLAAALERCPPGAGLPGDVEALELALKRRDTWSPEPLATFADIASAATGRDWAALATERIATWAASYFDRGQAAWRPASLESGAYVAWRQQAMIDRTPQWMGLARFHEIVKALPETAEAMVVVGASRLGLGTSELETYFHRLLMSVGGWAGYARYRVWQSELEGIRDETLLEFLAVCLAWDVALLEAHRLQQTVMQAWAVARARAPASIPAEPSLAIDHVLQVAYEFSWQRGLVAELCKPRRQAAMQRRGVQAAFCIDVRSEVFRRAFEHASAEVETIGFAGFFGLPIEYVPLGQDHGRAQCPVLLTPKFTVCETVQGASAAEQARIVGLRSLRRRAANAWKTFRMAAVSCFAFVETMGWMYLIKLATDGFGLTRTVPHPATDGIDAPLRERLGPDTAAGNVGGRPTGFTQESKVALAEAVLTAMSLRQDFARLVMLVGHGASTVNNPHASGLDCGACGGHSGEANARAAAAILNDPQVRSTLATRGIVIPADTVFLGCLHDTTTDRVTLFQTEELPACHRDELLRLQSWLATAGRAARAERAALLNLDPRRPVDAQIIARSRDWSQVRPEWGLAGCASFIAAPRHFSEALDLGGRAFLHSYDWRQDHDFGVLEMIMTAPMVVASWISLQYYGSTVDNRVFGCGNKVLHNVTGTLGVLEGNGGDLRTGLSWQSLHDGERLIHEPLRLSVVIAAPVDAINAVMAKNESVRELVDNGWLHLFAMTDGSAIQRCIGNLRWQPAT